MEPQTLAIIIIVAICALPFLWMAGRGMIADKNQAFVDLGDIRGKTLQEIATAVGQPTSMSAGPDGNVVWHWGLVGEVGAYHYAILFDAEGKALGYAHQFTTT